MPRGLRCADGGYVYHVLNRSVGRATLFHKAPDYTAFKKILRQAWERTAMRLPAPGGTVQRPGLATTDGGVPGLAVSTTGPGQAAPG